MSPDSERKRTIRNRVTLTGEDYTEAGTRLSMMAKIPSLPMPLVTLPDDRDKSLWGGRSARDLLRENFDGDGDFRYGIEPADVQHDNTRRAGFALMALQAYAGTVGTDADSIISDLLSDLRHLCDALGENFDIESERGARYYGAEIRGEY
jgi:hypothetical protein